MSSEAITRNDLTAILNEVLPPTPSEYKKLLWTNPSASYSTGTVSLDLSEYDEVEVVFATDDGLVVEFSASCPVGKSGHGEWWDIRSDLSNYAAINGVTRSFSTSSTGVTFQNGNMLYNGGSYNGWASRAIPRRIYGIKYERVAPPQADALEWRLAGTATGNTNTVTVPDSTKEVMVVIEATSGVVYTGMAVLAGLKAIWNVGGYYLSSSDIGLCNLNVSNSNKTFGIRNCRYGAGDYKTTAILSVYYR